LDSLSAPVVVLDDFGSVLLANYEFGRLLGLSGAAGRKLPERLAALAGDPGPRGRRVVVQTAEGPWVFNVRAVNIENHPRALAASGERLAAPVASAFEAGSLDGEAALAGQIGHKVKGPLAGIELYASILDEELAQSGQGELSTIIEEIRQGVRELNECLTSFESMTRILSLNLEELSLSDVVDEALSALSDLLKAKGVGVLVDQKALTVQGDRKLLVQLFLNIFLNAIEAMPLGGRLTVDIRENGSGQAEAVVTDTGPGIDMRRTKEIFNPFYTTKEQPLGLGLPVSRRIAEAHRGRIVAGSDVVLGARVAVTLPCLGGGEADSKTASETLKN
jgi:signal transduction histidine kinase